MADSVGTLTENRPAAATTASDQKFPSPAGGGGRGGGSPPGDSPVTKAVRTRATPNARKNAAVLRRDATHPESLLWDALRARQLNHFKFRRQHPIESFVVDFFCASAHLVIELDGESHTDRERQDQSRQQRLEVLGMRVLRFTNEEVLSNLEGVLAAIQRAILASGADPSPSPSP
ncbi:endonuclease domain-containing protein [Botrimarina hoheduenensis]|uniref:endonuclease domain-containing protein n=1 Tax=Botrimarina hoheduenensis TaxID=2528000 RepID=UPI0018D38C55|nr:endonuclease domain-containing protein [Botrimarina hoheduenensis]